ncbi:MAG: DUF4395 domain-containing protein [Campylobacterota bacterium]|nr:DUF4395 domain-containing protein [Campylobacterota bacterium]
MAHSCPINFERVDATTIRIISLIVISLITLHVSFPSPWILFFLATDFIMRLYGDKNYSLTYRLALLIQASLKLESKFEDAGAKRLAGHFGLLFTLLLLSAYLLELQSAFYVIASVFIGCAGLEVLFGFCVGCKVYFIIQKILPKS